MKIIHNLSLNVDSRIRQDFLAHGIELREGFTSFRIAETDENWPNIQPLITKYRVNDICDTKFTAGELRAANNVSMQPAWHHGYPEPSDDFGYRYVTYDTSNYCRKCGCGLLQRGAFRFSKEPVWGKKHILQLNWVFDEFFVRPEVWEKVFKPFGIDKLEVLHVKTEKPLETAVQIRIPEDKVPLVIGDNPISTCKECGRVKALPIARGPLPALQFSTDQHIFETQDYFGDGARAFNEVLISRKLYLAISDAKLRGVDFTVVAE